MRKIILFYILLFCISVSYSQYPAKISVQGVLYDSNGNKISNNSSQIIYSITDSQDNIKLGPATQNISIVNGIFNDSLDISQLLTKYNNNLNSLLYLQISYNGKLISKTLLTSSIYSMQAKTVDDSAITSFKIKSGEVVKNINGLHDNVSIVKGSGINISTLGNNITISTTGGSSSPVSFDATYQLGDSINTQSGRPFTINGPGGLKISNGANDRYVLTSDANGNAIWKPAPTTSGGSTTLQDAYSNGNEIKTTSNPVFISGSSGLNITGNTGLNINKLNLGGASKNGQVLKAIDDLGNVGWGNDSIGTGSSIGSFIVNGVKDSVILKSSSGNILVPVGHVITIPSGGGTGIQAVQNSDNNLNIYNPNGPIATIDFSKNAKAIPTGIAGGDLTGNYPNPTLNPGSITKDKFGQGTIDSLAWSLKGNAGTNSNNNFLGTVDNKKLNIIANNNPTLIINTDNTINVNGKIRINDTTFIENTGFGNTFLGYTYNKTNTGVKNTFIGYQTGGNNTTGINLTAIGYQALNTNTIGSHNSAIGYSSLKNNIDGNFNTAAGENALNRNTNGSYNTATGSFSLPLNSTGSNNTAIGVYSLYENKTGYSNVAIGANALYYNNDRSNLVAIGDSALYNNGAGTILSGDANWNTAVGSKSLFSNSSGSFNTAVGYNSLKGNVSGYSNIAIGLMTLFSNSSGSDNIGSGNFSLYNNISGSQNTAYGESSLYSLTKGLFNVAIGYNSLYSLMSSTFNSWNIAIGANALYSDTSGQANISIGNESLFSLKNGFDNTAIGYRAMYSSISVSDNTSLGSSSLYNNTVGAANIAIGKASLYFNTNGCFNIAVGNNSMNKNTIGFYNTSVGYQALYNGSTDSNNTAIGFQALFNNRTGSCNTAIGSGALQSSSTPGTNTACGYMSLANTSTGGYNTAIGNNSLQLNTTGYLNTSIGYIALCYNNSTGTGLTALGAQASVNTDNLNNVTMIGFNASGTASNQVRIGNTSVTSIGGYANWTNISDGRIKVAIQNDVKGLDFILKLNPITYQLNLNKLSDMLGENKHQIPNILTNKDSTNTNLDPKVDELIQKSRNEKSSIRYSGFVAQEVEQAAKDVNYDFSGIDKPKNENDFYGLRYSEFVVPLVKAVQEQQVIINSLLKRIEELEKKVK